MTTCDVNEDILSQCLLTFHELADAREEMDRAYTHGERVCAAARLRQVEQRWHSMLGDLMGHCNEHRCATEDTERLFRDFPVPVAAGSRFRQ